MTTVAINGREYRVEVRPEGNMLDPDMPAYILHGSRASYGLLRNRNDRHLMFVVPMDKAFGRNALRSVWLSDKTGDLRQVKLLR